MMSSKTNGHHGTYSRVHMIMLTLIGTLLLLPSLLSSSSNNAVLVAARETDSSTSSTTRMSVVDKLFRDYTIHHHRVVNNSYRLDNGEAAKMIIFRDPGCGDIVGMGNRLNGLISTMVLAMLTGRILLIDERLQDGSYKCATPCHRCHQLSMAFEDPPIDWRYPKYDSLFSIEPWIDWEKIGQAVITQEGSDGIGSVLAVTYRLDIVEDESIEWFMCTNFKALPQRNLVIYATQSFAHLLASNPYVGHQALSQYGTDAFAAVAEYFIPDPHPRLALQLNKFQKSMKTRSGVPCPHVIGIHIRRQRGTEFLDDHGEEMLFRCATWLSLDSGINDTCIYIAADNGHSIARAKKLIQLPVYSLDGLHAADSQSLGEQDSSIMEWFMLRRSDDLIITGGSSFGGTAAGSRGFKPVSVANVQSPGYDGPMCTRAITSFSIANPLYWLDPHAYKPNDKHPITCPAIDPLTKKHTPKLVFSGNIEGIAVPPQRGKVAPSSSWWTQHGLGWWRHLSDWPSFILYPLVILMSIVFGVRGIWLYRQGLPPFPCLKPLARLCLPIPQYSHLPHHRS